MKSISGFTGAYRVKPYHVSDGGHDGGGQEEMGREKLM